jgi:outer membrane beta-barrel protein
MCSKWLRICVCFSILMSSYGAWSQANSNSSGALDPRLKLTSKDDVSQVFEGIVAVQRKAKIKKGSFLIAPLFSFDFSDAPYTQYSLQLNAGYALSDFWEVYLAYTPAFAANERNLSKQVKQLPPAGTYSIDSQKPKTFTGIEINWLPIYGKDSWGPYSIVRSDTFVNFSYGQIQYTRDVGNKIKLAVGKTFFFSDYFNFRIQAGPSSVETFSIVKSPSGNESKKTSITIGLIETGLVFYF